jgi:hypothetical protein
MKIFIGSHERQKDDVRSKMSEMERLGHEFSHDWTQYNVSDVGQSQYASRNLKGIKKAAIFLGIMDDSHEPYAEAIAELSAAKALGKMIFIYCPNLKSECMKNYVMHHSGIYYFTNWYDGLKYMQCFLPYDLNEKYKKNAKYLDKYEATTLTLH